MYTNTNSWSFCQRAILENMIYQSYAVHKTNSDHILSLALTKGVVRYGSLYNQDNDQMSLLYMKKVQKIIIFLLKIHISFIALAHM